MIINLVLINQFNSFTGLIEPTFPLQRLFYANKRISYYFPLSRFLSLMNLMPMNFKLIYLMSMNFKSINLMSMNFKLINFKLVMFLVPRILFYTFLYFSNLIVKKKKFKTDLITSSILLLERLKGIEPGTFRF